MNDLRPLNAADRVSAERKRETASLQRRCLFLWVRYYAAKVVAKRVAVPSFIRYEECCQRFFAQILDEFLAESVHSDGERFRQYIHRLNAVEFVDSAKEHSVGGKGGG